MGTGCCIGCVLSQFAQAFILGFRFRGYLKLTYRSVTEPCVTSLYFVLCHILIQSYIKYVLAISQAGIVMPCLHDALGHALSLCCIVIAGVCMACSSPSPNRMLHCQQTCMFHQSPWPWSCTRLLYGHCPVTMPRSDMLPTCFCRLELSRRPSVPTQPRLEWPPSIRRLKPMRVRFVRRREK